MKRIFTALLMVATAVLLCGAKKSFAQAADTVLVPASPVGNINNFINGDTTKTGTTGLRNNPNRVYKLYDDSLYFFTGAITVSKYNLTITAPAPAAGHTPPEIVPAILAGGSAPNHFINALQGNVTLEHLYLQGIRSDEKLAGSICLNISGDTNSVFTTDSCVFDGWWYEALSGGGKKTAGS